MKKQTIELLAPAGSWEALEAAVNAGADAVYMRRPTGTFISNNVLCTMLPDCRSVGIKINTRKGRTNMWLFVRN